MVRLVQWFMEKWAPDDHRGSAQPRGLGRVEPDLGRSVVLETSKGVEQQEGLVRRPPPATSELTNAVEPHDQGLAVERDGTGRVIRQRVRHRSKVTRPGSRGKRRPVNSGRCSYLHRELLLVLLAPPRPETSTDPALIATITVTPDHGALSTGC
jgi:hypothetical protein